MTLLYFLPAPARKPGAFFGPTFRPVRMGLGPSRLPLAACLNTVVPAAARPLASRLDFALLRPQLGWLNQKRNSSAQFSVSMRPNHVLQQCERFLFEFRQRVFLSRIPRQANSFLSDGIRSQQGWSLSIAYRQYPRMMRVASPPQSIVSAGTSFPSSAVSVSWARPATSVSASSLVTHLWSHRFPRLSSRETKLP